MSRNKNSIPYSASDIEKYRKGELSAREMYDLEQAALEDPFLADAIEGLMQHPTLQEDLLDLHERLDAKLTRDTRRNRIIIIRRRISLAAAVILLLGIGYTFFYHHTGSPAEASAKTAAPRHAPEPATVAADTPASTVAGNTRAPAAQPEGIESKVAADRRRRPATTARSAGYLSTEPRSDNKASASTSNQVAPSTSNQVAPSNQLPPSLAKMAFKATPLIYSGKVLDLQNHPLAGAFLALNGNHSSGTVTDDQGQFMISLHPLDSTRQLTVSMIGYDRASLAVNTLSTDDQKDNVIHLRPSTANLDEVVVVGYGAHRKAIEVAAPAEGFEKLDTLWNIATPVIGRQAYLQYLGIAKKKLGLDTTITGTETVSFIVSRSGLLSSFKIEQSLSPAHDAGIIRLVTDGPAWYLLRGKKVRASVTVNF
jgi:hypothetical protein